MTRAEKVGAGAVLNRRVSTRQALSLSDLASGAEELNEGGNECCLIFDAEN